MTTTENKKSRSAELRERREKEMAELKALESVESLLPESLPLPSISNIDQRPGTIRAWLSFHAPYGEDGKAFALRVLSGLEAAGFNPLPVSLCKWDDYRRHTEPGLVEDQPETKPGCFGGTYKLTAVDAITPLWIEPCQHTGVEARCYYEKDGATFKVTVKVPLPAHLQCRRMEYRGGWRFDGPCAVQFPQAWHSINTDSGESIAHISQHTRGYRDTEQGISGTIYWMPLVEQDKFPMTPAQFLSALF